MKQLKAVTMMMEKKTSKTKQLFDFMETVTKSQPETNDEVMK